MTRPPGVPDDFVCKPCEQCGRPTWYPPAAESESAKRGLLFIVVCERAVCVKGAISKRTGTSTERIERAQALYPHQNPVDALWDQAALQPGKAIDIGRLVACDDCGTDYTDSPMSGGFVWHNRATCPPCADNVLKTLATQKLLRLMQSGQHCPTGTSFADFVRELRAGDATIKVNPPKNPT